MGPIPRNPPDHLDPVKPGRNICIAGGSQLVSVEEDFVQNVALHLESRRRAVLQVKKRKRKRKKRGKKKENPLAIEMWSASSLLSLL